MADRAISIMSLGNSQATIGILQPITTGINRMQDTIMQIVGDS